jgi:hypothetical protein
MLKVEILTQDEELATICKMYWQVDVEWQFVHKVGELAKLTNIERAATRLPQLMRESCYAYIEDWRCPRCEKPHKFYSRSEFSSNRRSIGMSFLCDECRRQDQIREAVETQKRNAEAERTRQETRTKMREKIRETYDLSKKRPISHIYRLSLTDAIYLISIMRGAYEGLTKIKPIELFEQPLAADKDLTKEIVIQVHDNRLIYVHPDSEPEAFVDETLDRFYIYKVYYAPMVTEKSVVDPKSLVTDLHQYVSLPWTEEECDEALKLWKKIALSECMEYLLFVLDEHHFEFTPGEKTTQYIEFALQHFSTAQVYNIIWRSAKDAAAFYLREKGVTKQHAANTAVAGIQRTAERAVSEKWDLKPYRRNYKTKQSIISEVFYNFALGIGEAGFETVPRIETIHAKKLEHSD